jgi:hypothetical protein
MFVVRCEAGMAKRGNRKCIQGRTLFCRGHSATSVVLPTFLSEFITAERLTPLVAKTLGYREVVLNSQTHAMPFYARAGFAPEGEKYEGVGISHRTMRRVM